MSGDPVGGDRSALGVVEVVGPVVDIVGPRSDGFAPRAVAANVGHAAGAKDPHQLLLGDLSKILGDDQVHQVVDVGQMLPVKQFGRHSPAEVGRLNVRPGLGNIGRIGIESLDDKRTADPKGCGQTPVVAAELDYQATLDTGGFQDLVGRLTGRDRRGRLNCKKNRTQGCQSHSSLLNSHHIDRLDVAGAKWTL